MKKETVMKSQGEGQFWREDESVRDSERESELFVRTGNKEGK